MPLVRYGEWRFGSERSLPSEVGSVVDAIISIPITEPEVVAVLNEEGEGDSLVYTKSDSTTKLPHQIVRADWPSPTDGCTVSNNLNHPQAIHVNGYTVWGSLNQSGEVYSHWLKIDDGTRGDVLLKTLTTGTGSGIDDHNSPAYLELASGKIIVSYSPHNGAPAECRRSTNVGDPTAWDSAVTIEGSASVSYSKMFQLASGRLVYLYRVASATYPHQYKTSDDDGATWSSAVTIFQSPDNGNRTSTIARPYVHAWLSADKTKLHFACTDGHPGEVSKPSTSIKINSVYHCYYDTATGNLHKSDGSVMSGGTFASPPSGGFDTADMTKVLDGYTLERPFWVFDIQLDSSGRPVIAGMDYRGDTSTPYTAAYHFIARWTGSAWSVATLEGVIPTASTPVASTDREPYYHGGIALKHDDPTGTAYISSDDPDSGLWSIWRIHSADGGDTWTLGDRLNTMRGAQRKCIRPIPVLNYPGTAGSGPEVFWCEGHYGDYQISYTGSGSTYAHNLFATGIQSYPRIIDGYIARVRLPLGTSVIHEYWGNAEAEDQSDPDTVYSGWLEYPRDVYLSRWDTGRLVDMGGNESVTVLWEGIWDRAAFTSSQHTHLSNWEDSRAALLMREQSAGGSNIACLFYTTTGLRGNTAWSSSPAVQTPMAYAMVWAAAESSGQIRPYKNGTALTTIAASAAAMPANSVNTLRIGHTPHTNAVLYWRGRHSFVGISPAALSSEWIAEFQKSNPLVSDWSYAPRGDIVSFDQSAEAGFVLELRRSLDQAFSPRVLDGGAGWIGTFRKSTSGALSLVLVNIGDTTGIITRHGLLITGNVQEGVFPSFGFVSLGPGESYSFSLVLDTSAGGTGLSANISQSHDQDGSPFTASLGFDVSIDPECGFSQLVPTGTTMFVTEEQTWGEYDATQEPLGIEFAAEEFKNEIKVSDGRRYMNDTGRAAETGRASFHSPAGAIDGEWQPHGCWPLFLRHALGDPVTTTGPSQGTYTHTMKGRNELPDGLTIEKVLKHRNGDLRRFRYEGCKVDTFFMRAAAGSMIQTRAAFVARKESNPAGDPPLPTYPSYNDALSAGRAIISLNFASSLVQVPFVQSIEFTIANNLKGTAYSTDDGAYRCRLPAGGRTISGAMRAMFTADVYTIFQKAIANTTGVVRLMVQHFHPQSGETYSLRVTLPKVQFRMDAPQTSGRGPIFGEIRFVAAYDAATGSDIEAVCVNRDPLLET